MADVLDRPRPISVVKCTQAQPWDGSDQRVAHPDAVELRRRDAFPLGTFIDYECPNCRKRFTLRD